MNVTSSLHRATAGSALASTSQLTERSKSSTLKVADMPEYDGIAMKIHRIVTLAIFSILFSVALVSGPSADQQAVQGWDPALFQNASTIKIMTTEPDVGEHWFNLWVVVIDGQPYVRLGDRSYGRIQKNTTGPYVKLIVADKEFDRVKVDDAPDMKEKVGAAMADKYWLDILIRHEAHPMVARLVPEAAPPQTSTH